MPKVPAACADLDLAQVSRVLAKHYGDIAASARELNVSGPDLRHLTWARPKVLEEAQDECDLVVARVWGELTKAVYSDNPRRRQWGADKILSSWLARDHPFAPARRGRGAEAVGPCAITFRWAGADGKDEDPATLERDGRTVAVPRYSGEVVRSTTVIEVAELAAPSPEQPQLPKGPPPLVQQPPQPQQPPDPEARSRRRLSRGGYRSA
jgi:hypothetical protein